MPFAPVAARSSIEYRERFFSPFFFFQNFLLTNSLSSAIIIKNEEKKEYAYAGFTERGRLVQAPEQMRGSSLGVVALNLG